jgi:peptide deformylase
MAVLNILKFGNPVLTETAKKIEKIDESLKNLIDNMTETMYAAPGVGLAAVQVGILKQMFVYDIGDGPEVVINPEIVKTEGETIEEEEGCLSVPEVRVPVKRFEKIELTGLDKNGKKIRVKAEGLLARAFQHEIDHLNGKLILDRTSKDERRKALHKLNELAGII